MAAPIGDDLVGVDRLVRLLAGELLDQLGDGGHAGGAADEDHVVEVALGDAGILEGLLERDAAALDQVGGHLLELGRVSVSSRCSGPSAVAVMNGRLIWVDWVWLSSILAFSAASLQALHRHAVRLEVDALGVLELVDEPVDDALVPVVAAEARCRRGST